jgi:hypothetical protein
VDWIEGLGIDPGSMPDRPEAEAEADGGGALLGCAAGGLGGPKAGGVGPEPRGGGGMPAGGRETATPGTPIDAGGLNCGMCGPAIPLPWPF